MKDLLAVFAPIHDRLEGCSLYMLALFTCWWNLLHICLFLQRVYTWPRLCLYMCSSCHTNLSMMCIASSGMSLGAQDNFSRASVSSGSTFSLLAMPYKTRHSVATSKSMEHCKCLCLLLFKATCNFVSCQVSQILVGPIVHLLDLDIVLCTASRQHLCLPDHYLVMAIPHQVHA